MAEGCAALADAYEAHLSSHVAAAAGPAAANAAPAAIAECFSADLCAWLDGGMIREPNTPVLTRERERPG